MAESAQEKPQMSDAEYSATQQQLVLLARLVRKIDVRGFLDRISLAQSVAPFLDPTLYIQGHRNLEAIADLARGASAFKRAADDVAARFGEGDGNAV